MSANEQMAAAASLGFVAEVMRRPERRELGIRTLPSGWQLTVRGHAVGRVYMSEGDVREAYKGLAAEPARQVA